jgi:hypothetical protein
LKHNYHIFSLHCLSNNITYENIDLIAGLTVALPGEDKEPATDKMPYTTIVYGNGPGYTKGGPFNGRTNLTGVNTCRYDFTCILPMTE